MSPFLIIIIPLFQKNNLSIFYHKIPFDVIMPIIWITLTKGLKDI